MPFARIPLPGSVGVIKDVGASDIPLAAWSDAQNIRFLDGAVYQAFGHGQVYGTPTVNPLHVMPVISSGQRYWLYAGTQKIYAVTITGGAAVHTNLTRQTAGSDVNYSGTANAWTSTSLNGIPILNAGNTTDPPQMWDLNIANRMTALTAWPANTYCKAMRAYKNFLVALNVTKTGTNYPYMVKWSHPADPGSVPSSWDQADATKDAGELVLADDSSAIVDGGQLRDSFIIYTEVGAYRMDYVGGQYVMAVNKIVGVSGLMNRNCWAEFDGLHFCLTNSDVIVHDGQTWSSILDNKARRALFQDFDSSYTSLAFVFKNPFMNEIYVAYASIGSTVPNKALVYNYKAKTVSYRSLPNLNHANFGQVDNSLNQTWGSDSDPWGSDLAAWNGPDFVPNVARVLMASNDTKLFLLDSQASYDGSLPSAYVERRSLHFDAPEKIKLIKSVRLRSAGNTNDSITVKVGTQDDPNTEPTYTTMTHTIGSTYKCDCLVSGRYISIWIGTGSAYFWRVDSVEIEYDLTSDF